MNEYDYLYLSFNAEKASRKKRTSGEKQEIIALHPFCVYCGCDDVYDLVLDHIYPVSFGGSSDLHNITIACSRCNSHKYNYPIDYFLKKMIEKRDKLSDQCRTYIRNLRNLRRGKPDHYMHSQERLIGRICNLRYDHFYYSKIINSLLHGRYQIF